VTLARVRLALLWLVGPLVAVAVAGWLGSARAKAARGELFAATSSLPELERRRLEVVPLRVMDNAVWMLGGWELTRKLLKLELDTLGAPDELDGPRRARVLIRFGMIDTNFDGQAAVFAAACVADPSVCDTARLKAAAEEEAQRRFVSPGNHLPLSLIGGHPPIPGAF
jgi:hypothetical protein